MRAELVNFELWFTYDDYHDHDKILRLTYELAIQDIQTAIQEKNVTCIIGLLWIDGMLYKNNEEFYSLLKRICDQAKQLGIEKMMLIVGSCAYYQQELNQRGIDCELIYFDGPIRWIYNDYFNIVDRSNELCPWNPDADKFLYLGGIPSRPNRIGLLSKYYDAKLLAQAEWSFFPPWTDKDQQWCRQYLNHYTDDQYKTFLIDCEKSIDEVYEQSKDYSRVSGKEIADRNLLDSPWIQEPHYINPKIYTDTCLSIIAEGAVYPPANEYRFITEKTWRTVLNKHPFILADHPTRWAYLKDLGLRTFEDYMLIKDYASIVDDNERFDAIVANTKYFLETFKDNLTAISEDIEYNYQRYFELKLTQDAVLNNLQKTYIIDQNSIDKWFSTSKLSTYIRVARE